MSICVVKGCEQNVVFNELDLKEKTIAQIAPIISLKENSFIAVHVPMYQKRLNETDIPLALYPQLILPKRPGKYPPPDYYLRIVEEDDYQFDFELYLGIKTQIETEFPKISLRLSNQEVNTLKVSDILSRTIENFEYACSNEKLIFEGSDLDISQDAKQYIDSSLAKSEYIIFECEIKEKPEKKINHRIFNTNQIIATEQTYINDLNEIIMYWDPAFRESRLFTEDELRTLFRDVPIIKNFHSVFLDSINSGKVTFATEIGTKFLAFVQFFKLSATFVSQYKQVDEMIKTKMKNRSFESKLKEIEGKLPNGSGRDFLSYYITPVQRYPRYPLLIRDLDKETPHFHPDKPYLAAALVEVEKVLKEIDHSSYTMNALEVMDNLQKDFGFKIEINDPQRQLKFSASIKINRPKPTAGTIFLFNDLIVVASQPKKTYHYVFHSTLSRFRFSNINAESNSFMLYFDNRDYTIQFANHDDKAKFIETYHEELKRFTRHLRKKETDVSYAIWNDVLPRNEKLPQLMCHDGCICHQIATYFGGVANNMATTNTLIRYDLMSKEVSINCAVLKHRELHTATSIGHIMYVCFGKSRKEVYSDIWKYDEKSEGWKQVSTVGEPTIARCGHSAVYYNDTIVMFGGCDKNNNYLNDICIFDTKTNRFKRLVNLANAPLCRAYHSACVIDDQMYIFGGRHEHGICNELCAFDLAKNRWIEGSTLNIEQTKSNTSTICTLQGRMQHKIFPIQNRFIAIIGGISVKDSPMLEVIDTYTWEIINIDNYGNMPFGCSKFAAVPYDETRILMYGGVDASGKTPTNLMYKLNLHYIGNSVKHITIPTRPVPAPVPSPKPPISNENEQQQQEDVSKPSEQATEPFPSLEQATTEQPSLTEQINGEQPSSTEQITGEQPSSTEQINAEQPSIITPQGIHDKTDNKPFVSPVLDHVESLPIKHQHHKVQSESAKGSALQRSESHQIANINEIAQLAKQFQDKRAQSGAISDITNTHTVHIQENPVQNQESNALSTNFTLRPVKHHDPVARLSINENDRRKSIGPLHFPAVYDLIVISKIIGIDCSKLSDFERIATDRKLKTLWRTNIENQEKEKQLSGLQKDAAQQFTVDPNKTVIVKVQDDTTQITQIIKATSGDSLDVINQKITAKINRTHPMLTIVVGDHKDAFSEDSLHQAYLEIFKGDAKCVKVIAL